MKFLKLICSKCKESFVPTCGGLHYMTERFTNNMLLFCDKCANIDKYAIDNVKLTKSNHYGSICDSVEVRFKDGTIQENIEYNYFPETKFIRLNECELPEYTQTLIVEMIREKLIEKGLM